MSYAYRQIYLDDAMKNLGEMTEYAHDACGTDLDRTLKYFVISGYADRFGKGDPAIVSGMSGTELYMNMAEKIGIVKKKWPDPLVKYEVGEYYWAGYILAMFQWESGYTFAQILSRITAEDLLRLYPALHTASEERAVEELNCLFRKKSEISRLQEYRKRIGMTQAELSKASGVNLRTLQQYETGAKSVSKASAETVVSLANVLECRPEELIEG